MDGFLLDRGFQVLLTAYPEARAVLDYAALDLKKFTPGTLSWFAGRMNQLVDPWRTPGAWMDSLRSDFCTFRGQLRIARLRSRLRRKSIEEIFSRPERFTKDALQALGFSQEFIHRFFRPFFGGILLDTELKSSSRMFEFISKCFPKEILPSRRVAWARFPHNSPQSFRRFRSSECARRRPSRR